MYHFNIIFEKIQVNAEIFLESRTLSLRWGLVTRRSAPPRRFETRSAVARRSHRPRRPLRLPVTSAAVAVAAVDAVVAVVDAGFGAENEAAAADRKADGDAAAHTRTR